MQLAAVGGIVVGSWVTDALALGASPGAVIGKSKADSPPRDGWNLAHTSLIGDRDASVSGTRGVTGVSEDKAADARLPLSISAALLRISSTEAKGALAPSSKVPLPESCEPLVDLVGRVGLERTWPGYHGSLN